MPFLLSANNGTCTPFSDVADDGWPWVKLIDGEVEFSLKFNATWKLRCRLRIGGPCVL